MNANVALRPDAYRLEGVAFSRVADFVLEIPSLTISAGRVHAVVGQNGSGKTTLVELLGFLEFPERGAIDFCGERAGVGASETLGLRRRLGIVFQEPYLFHRSLLDNAAFGLRARGVPRREAAQRAREALGFTGLAHLAHRRGNQLSGGERKRAALAMALAPNPEVLLLDELTSNVDAAYRRVLEELIVKANVERGCTVVFTTHDFDQAYRLAHHVISLHEGTVIDFIPENVFTCEIVAEAGRKVARLPGGPNIELAAGEPGRAKIVLPPESLIVSRGPLESSARNHLPGVIARADLRGETVTLTVDVGVPLLARLSLASHRELGLDLGQQVVLTFKIHAVRVI